MDRRTHLLAMRLVVLPSILALLVASFVAVRAPITVEAIGGNPVISQVYGGGGNSGATFTHDFIELHNPGTSAVSLTGWEVQYGSAGGGFTQATALSGSIAPGGYYLVQEAQGAGGTTPLPTPDATGAIAMSATAGKVRLVDTADAVIDLVGYGPTATTFEGSGPTPAPSNTTAVLRNDGGATDTDNNALDFVTGTPNPRNGTTVPPPPTGCDAPATHEIAAVQGPGTATPLAGTPVRVEGIVTGDFQGATSLGGIFIQDPTPDADPLTSDGIFAFTGAPAAVGDRVLVSGTAIEFSGLTELSPVIAVDVCGTGTIAPMTYDLPRPVGGTFEPVEGVLVTFPEALSATEHFQLGRFGEITVASDGRAFQPTERVAPGAAAIAELDATLRRMLLIDDGSNAQNPTTVPYLLPEAVRIGDTATGVTGVLSFGFARYRLQPTEPITFDRANPRPAEPADVGGALQVASFNTLNYFTTLGSVNPNARGADTAEEFARQQAKGVEAIIGLDADVIGLMEVENNGPTAIGSLVDALNAATAPGTYAFVSEPVLNAPNEFGGTFGTDAIKVALIYRPVAVTPVGAAQTSADAVFDRPPLIQTFQPAGDTEPLTVVVNHFKSKGCDGAAGADLDQGDGQSCFNARRTAQASTLVTLLDTLDAPNALLVGDLNAYSQEDPIGVLEAAGYVGLSEEFVADADRYSFVFDGFSGELDHGLAAGDLIDNVTGAAIWHINADEPLILDYNTEFNPPGLYQPDAFRSSDHDPLIVGLDLANPATVPAAPDVAALAGWGAATVSWSAPDDGGSPITGYELSITANGSGVRTVSLGPDATEFTAGQLANGVTHTFAVSAVNDIGMGPAGEATAKPFVPRHYQRLDARTSCPSFTATNRNAFPVSFSWIASSTPFGVGVVAAGETVAFAPVPRQTSILVLFAGIQVQDVVIGRCR